MGWGGGFGRVCTSTINRIYGTLVDGLVVVINTIVDPVGCLPEKLEAMNGGGCD